jgi:hypothetical protein
MLFEIPHSTVYAAMKNICDGYDLGFRIARDPSGTNRFFFDVYSGIDRTTKQTARDAVIFDPDLDNLKNTTEFTSIADFKTTAIIFSPMGSKAITSTGAEYSREFKARHLLVIADDIKDMTAEEADAAMIRRAREELAKHGVYMAFDGEIQQNSQYKYGTDYHLGDMVEMRSGDGLTNQMRVTEQIFVSDAEGERSYPTLSLSRFITPGTWLGWDFDKTWADYTTVTDTWDTLP